MQLRIARHTERLEEVVAFYRDGYPQCEAGDLDVGAIALATRSF
jgi:hypothetical protein